jgi:predicted porin
MKKKAILAMAAATMLTTSIGFAAPLSDYSAGKTSIDLTWRQSDVKTTDSEAETSFGKKSNLDWGITTGLGNNFAIQYNGYNAKSKDAVSWSDVDETGISHVDLKTQELNVLYKLNKNVSVYTGLVRLKAEENANVSYTDGSPSETESYSTKTKNKIQFGVIGSTKLAEKTTAYAQVGVASNFNNWKVGVSQEIAPNVEFNVDYRRLKAKKLDFGGDDGNFDVSSKGIGFGITCKF